MRLPSLKFLKTFQVAARLKSFKAAAEELHLTPSAVSHQIKALEEQLGVALFERGMRTLALTDAGAHYLEHISDIFARLESVTEQLKMRYGRSILRLNVPPFFARALLLPRLASFTQEREGSFQHLSGRQAGNMAREAGVGRLILTHRWPTVSADAVRREAELAFGRAVAQASPGDVFDW